MGYTEEVMQSLMYRIRDLNNNISSLSELNAEIKRANDLKELELGLLTGAYTKEEGKALIESMKPAPAPQKSKSFWKNN